MSSEPLLPRRAMMRFRVLAVVVLSLAGEVVFCFIKTGSENTIIKKDQAKDFTTAELTEYLKKFESTNQTSEDLVLNFPKSLKDPKYTLSDGEVLRYYDPLPMSELYDRMMFYREGDEFYGVIKVYTPKIELQYKYQTQTSSGSFNLIVTHSPLEVQMRFGSMNGDVCVINRDNTTVRYFYDDELHVTSKVHDKSPEGETAAHEVIKHTTSTWLIVLYKDIIMLKLQQLVNESYKKMLEDPKTFKNIARICEEFV